MTMTMMIVTDGPAAARKTRTPTSSSLLLWSSSSMLQTMADCSHQEGVMMPLMLQQPKITKD